MGHGKTSTAFKLTIHDAAYVVRIPTGREIRPEVVESHTAAAVLARGVPHLEQIVAASYTDGFTVAEMLPGKRLYRLTADEISRIPNDHLNELIPTLLTAYGYGIELDLNMENFIYDRKTGFGIIDFEPADLAIVRKDRSQVVGYAIRRLGVQESYEPETTEDYDRVRGLYEASRGVLIRYRQQVEQRLTGEDGRAALRVIDRGLRIVRTTIGNYADPEWVAFGLRAKRLRDEHGDHAPGSRANTSSDAGA